MTPQLAVYDFALGDWARLGAQPTPPVGTAPSIVTTSFNAMTEGQAFSQTLVASSAVPVTWNVVDGALPSGLSLNPASGAITGTPVSSGSYSVTVRATNTFGWTVRTYTGTVAGTGASDWPEDLFLARDFDGLDAWYAANTGPRVEPTLELPGANIDLEWLWEHDDGEHVYEDGGRWYVQNIATHNFGVFANNITFRGCIVNPSEGWRGIQAPLGQNPTGIVIEETEVFGGGDWEGILFPAATNPGQITVRRANVHGFRVAIQIYGGMTVEESWVHDSYYGPGDPHVTGMSIRNRNVTVRRDRIADGNSAGLAFYNENSPYTNILAEQNIVSTPNSIYEIAYTGNHPPGSNVVRLLTNLFDRGAFTGASNFSEVSGNVRRNGTPVP